MFTQEIANQIIFHPVSWTDRGQLLAERPVGYLADRLLELTDWINEGPSPARAKWIEERDEIRRALMSVSNDIPF